MANPVIRGFKSLLRFKGRDRGRDFWPYAVVAGVLGMVLCFGLVGWAMSGFWSEVSTFSQAHPESTTVNSGPGHYSVQIDIDHPDAPVPDFNRFFSALRGGIAIIVAFLASAVTRRLHDTGRTGAWGLLPLIFVMLTMTAMPIVMQRMMSEVDSTTMGLFGLLFLSNMLYLASLAGLIFLLAQKSDPDTNRFGPPPTA